MHLNWGGYTKSEVDTLLTDYIPKMGGVITGTSLGRIDNTSSITVCGGTDNSKGGSITIYGKDRTNNNGEFSLVANDGTSSSELWGKPNGTLTWGNKKVDTIEEQGEEYIRYSNGIQICWGTMAITWSLQEQYAYISFAKSFKGDVSVSLTHTRSGYSPYTYSEISATYNSTFSVSYVATLADGSLDGTLSWTAIGRWK